MQNLSDCLPSRLLSTGEGAASKIFNYIEHPNWKPSEDVFEHRSRYTANYLLSRVVLKIHVKALETRCALSRGSNSNIDRKVRAFCSSSSIFLIKCQYLSFSITQIELEEKIHLSTPFVWLFRYWWTRLSANC